MVSGESKKSGQLCRKVSESSYECSKSQLAIETAHQFRRKSPDTFVFWLFASSQSRLEQSIRATLEQLQVSGIKEPTANAFELFRTWLLDRKQKRTWLVIVDNADEAEVLLSPSKNVRATETQGNTQQDEPTERCLDFLPYSEYGSLLLTSRSKAVASQVAHLDDVIDIKPMDQSHALALLRQKLGVTVEADQDDLAQLVTELESMPLAITQAAAYIRQREPRCSVKDYLEELSTSTLRLLNHESPDIRRDGAAQNCILRTLQISFRHIRRSRSSAADLLALMSFCDRHAIPETLLLNRHVEQHFFLNKCLFFLLLVLEVIIGGLITLPFHRLGSHTASKGTACSKLGPPSKPDKRSQDTFNNDLQILRSYSLITITTNSSEFEMHRLVQLATQDWLKLTGSFQRWGMQFVTNLNERFPTYGSDGILQPKDVCSRLYSHTIAAMRIDLDDLGSILRQANAIERGGWWAYFSGKYNDFLEMNSLVLETGSKVLGPQHPDTLESMGLLGGAYKLLGQYEKAESLQIEVFRQYKRLYGRHDGQTLRIMHDLGQTHERMGKVTEAHQLQLQALDDAKKTFGKRDRRTLQIMTAVAGSMAQRGQHEAAETLLKRVLKPGKGLHPADDLDGLRAMSNLGRIYFATERFSEARRLFEDAHRGTETLLGSHHPNTLVLMSNLAEVLRELGQRGSATKLMRECAEKTNQRLGPNHPYTVEPSGWLKQWEAEDESYVTSGDEAETHNGACSEY